MSHLMGSGKFWLRYTNMGADVKGFTHGYRVTEADHMGSECWMEASSQYDECVRLLADGMPYGDVLLGRATLKLVKQFACDLTVNGS